MSRVLGPKGRALIKQFEGCAKKQPDGRFKAYPDPASGGDPWTIGWGSTGPDVKPGTIWTQAECDARFDRDVQAFADRVSRAIGDSATTAGQFSGMVSLAYNIGMKKFSGSTLLRLHKAGNYDAAAVQFIRWNRAAGKVMEGLTRRRLAEAALYRGDA